MRVFDSASANGDSILGAIDEAFGIGLGRMRIHSSNIGAEGDGLNLFARRDPAEGRLRNCIRHGEAIDFRRRGGTGKVPAGKALAGGL